MEEIRRAPAVYRDSALAVAAGALAIAALPPLLGRGTDTAPSGMPSTSSASSSMGDPAARHLGTGTVWTLPGPGQVEALPMLDLGLPTRIAVPNAVQSLTDHPISTVRAVLMTDAAGGGYHPVLVDPSGEYRIVADVTVQPTADEGGNTRFSIGPGTVSPDGTKVVLPSRQEVVIIDLAAGTRVRVPVPDPYLEWAGWSVDGSVVARSAQRAWTLVVGQRSVRELPLPAGAGHYGLVEDAGKAPVLATFDASGRLQARAALPPLVASGWQLAASSLTGWVATGVFLTPAASTELDGAYQGVLAVNADTPSSWRLLVPPDGAGAMWSKGCCSAQGWAGQRLVVVQAQAASTSWLLAWDTDSGRLYRVSALTPSIVVDGTPLVGPLAIGPLPDPR